MRMLVPTGYMAMVSEGSITIELCPGSGPASMAAPAVGMTQHDGAMAGMAHHDGEEQPGKGGQPCPFATLGSTPLAPNLGAFDLAAVFTPAQPLTPRPLSVAPGRGMAAPPPPSHAPPAHRA